MKKASYLLLPLVLVLTGCQFSIGYDKNSHEPGLDKSYSQSTNNQKSYTYFTGDQIESIGLTKEIITIKEITKAESDIKDIEKLNNLFDRDASSAFETVSNPSYVGVKEEGLFIGTDSSYLDGELTFNFVNPIHYVEIVARAYTYVVTSFNEYSVSIDYDAAIAVNDSPYIKMNGKYNEETERAESVTCRYHLTNPSNAFTIKVGLQRAFIEVINVYY